MDTMKLHAAAPTVEPVQLSDVCHYAELILASIEGEQREADEWEADDLMRALGFLQIGWKAAAVVALQRAIEPPARRAPGWNDGRPRPTIREMRSAFTEFRNRV